MSDQAVFDGSCIAFARSKVSRCDRLLLAIARTGRSTQNTPAIIEEWLATLRTQEEAISGLTGLLRAIRAEMPDEEPLAHIGMAIWRGRAEIYRVGYDTGPVGPVMRVSSTQLPPSAMPLPERCDDIEGFRALIEDQRRVRDVRGNHSVGTAAELTIVSRKGITSEIIHRWPDKLGEPITP